MRTWYDTCSHIGRDMGCGRHATPRHATPRPGKAERLPCLHNYACDLSIYLPATKERIYNTVSSISPIGLYRDVILHPSPAPSSTRLFPVPFRPVPFLPVSFLPFPPRSILASSVPAARGARGLDRPKAGRGGRRAQRGGGGARSGAGGLGGGEAGGRAAAIEARRRGSRGDWTGVKEGRKE